MIVMPCIFLPFAILQTENGYITCDNWCAYIRIYGLLWYVCIYLDMLIIKYTQM